MRHLPQKLLLPALITALMAPTVQAAETITEAFKEGKADVSFRLRYEDVDDADPGKDSADALTLKTRLTYSTAEFKNFSMLLEADNTSALTDVEYNDLTNGLTDKTVIADPKGTDANQYYIAYSGIPDTTIKGGQQRINLDNQRFVGGVGFRQNEQTYQAVTLSNSSLPDTSVFLGYISNVHDIKGTEEEHETLLFNVSYKGLPFGAISGYLYNFEQEQTGGYDLDVAGIRVSGAQGTDTKFLYTAEYASQDQNNGSKPDYYVLEGGLVISGITAKLGMEVLGGDNGAGFNTPLATKHKFQGWTDQFLATPATGIQDTYLSLGTTLAGVKLLAVYHDYEADVGSDDLGDELGFMVAKNFDETYGLSLKYSSYNASDESGKFDKDKLWLTATAKF